MNWVDPWGLSGYVISYQIKSIGIGWYGIYDVSGTVVATLQNDDGTHQAAHFSGRLYGVGYGLPFGYSEGEELCEDTYNLPDVRRIEGRSGFLSGTIAGPGKKDNMSGGMLRFGELVGINESISNVRGFDFGVDLAGGKISIEGQPFEVTHQFYNKLIDR